MIHAAKTWLAAALLLATVSSLYAQSGQSGYNRGYASDSFEGFDAFSEDTRIPQKKKSFWYSASEATPEKQLEYARKREADGHIKSARKAYEALIRKWPTSPFAAEAQLNLAHLLEKDGKRDKAFDEYQYLLTYYAGHCPFNEVLDRQFRIANSLLHNNRSMFGWILSGMDPIRERFEQIIRNAPRSAIAPEVMLIIGSIRVSEKQLEEAVAVYDGILNRFPSTPQAISAAYLAAQCRHTLAVQHRYNEPRCRDAISFFKAVLARSSNHPQHEQMTAWLKELSDLLLEQNYQQAVFYDTRQRNTEAAKAAYRRFLTEFADSKYGPEIRNRLVELENGAPPARK
jgi:outer membrane protein assembly factor BamD (BamD/ComL family)